MIHLSKDASLFHPSLLNRLIRAGCCVPLFTEKQKSVILTVAQVACPLDLIRYVYNPPMDLSNASSAESCVSTKEENEDEILKKSLKEGSSLARVWNDPWKWTPVKKPAEMLILTPPVTPREPVKTIMNLEKQMQELKISLEKEREKNQELKKRLEELKRNLKSLERRNDELEFVYLKSKDQRIWGCQGLWMEFAQNDKLSGEEI
jgi:hypothetical protein